MIELEKVCRSFPLGEERVHALVDVDEPIQDGEHVAIMGPSGSGKSTLLNILGCLDKPSSGVYKLDGREVGGLGELELTEVRRHQIGFVFQFFHLVPRLTALENVELPMVFAGIALSDRRERATQAIARVGMNGRAGHRPDQLSGGERQRVALARATVMGPRLPWCTTRDLGPQLSFTHGFEVPHEHFQTHSAEVCEEGLSREELA